jgi:hypothetical protein
MPGQQTGTILVLGRSGAHVLPKDVVVAAQETNNNIQ